MWEVSPVVAVLSLWAALCLGFVLGTLWKACAMANDDIDEFNTAQRGRVNPNDTPRRAGMTYDPTRIK